MRNLAKLLAAPAILTLAVAACGGGTAAPTASSAAATATPTKTPVKLTVAYSNLTADNLAQWTAKEGGYFAKNGLDVDLQSINGGAQTSAALVAGQVQIATLGGSEVASAAVAGSDLVVLGNLASVYPYLFMVPKDITTAEQLKGKKVGVSNFGGSSDIATRVALKKLGLDPAKDVSIIAVGSHANRTAALLSGSIQGGVDDPPENAELEAHGFHSLFDLASLKLPGTNTVIAAQRSWVSAHKDVAQAYIDSIVQAVQRNKQDKAFCVTVLEKYFKSTDDKAMEEAWSFFTGEVTQALPYAKPDQFVDGIAELSKTNAKLKDFDVTKIIDSSFLDNAASRGLGKY